MRFLFSRQYTLSLACLAVFGIVVLIPNLAFAQLGFLGGIAAATASAIGSVIVGIVLAITAAILGIASLMLQLAIDPFFIRLPYTTGPIVDAGWTVVRDLANMLIVFFLIIIGLGTALRLGQYEASKTLPKLIGVALLINFTPVITGFIVDISNVFMNFFLDGLLGIGVLGSIFGNIASGLSNDLPNFLDPAVSLSFFLKLVVIAIFNIFAAIVFFLFAALFIIRRVAIWILVILSPVAFVASVLPGTSGLFKMWWSQFFQWSIIGIFAAFFLWLGDQIISIASQGTLVAQAPPENFVADTINEVMPFGIALAMLLVGFFVALQASGAMGAGATKAFAMKGLAWSGATVGTSLWRKYGGKAATPGTKMATLGAGLQQWGKQKQAAGGLMAPVGVAGAIAGWGIRTSGEAAASGAQELSKQVRFRDTAALNNAEKEVDKMPAKEDVLATINNELLKPVTNWNRVLGLFNGLIKRGDGNDLENAFKPGGALEGKHALIGKLAKMGGSRFGPHGERPILKTFYGSIFNNPEKFGFNIKDGDLEADRDVAGRVVFRDIQRDAAGNTVVGDDERPVLRAGARKGSDAQYLELQKTKIPDRMAPADFEKDVIAPSNFDPREPEGNIFVRSMMIGRGAELMGQLVRRRNKADRQAIVNFIENEFANNPDWFSANSGDVLKWFTSTGARNLGLSIKSPFRAEEALTIADVTKLIDEYRARAAHPTPPPTSPPPTSPPPTGTPPTGTTPPPPTSPPSPPRGRPGSLGSAPSGGTLPSSPPTSPPPTPSSSPPTPPTTPLPTPRWLTEGLRNIREGGVPSSITRQMREYLQFHGVTTDEINRMTPRAAWDMADRLSRRRG